MASGYEIIEPRCPFCNQRLDRPKELEPMRRGDFEYGVCSCGAVFVHDVTGFNLGAAMVEALEFACDADLDLAWDLMPGEDYNDALIEGYDINKHLIYPAGHDYEGHRVKGALSFIRLNDDIRDTKEEGVRLKYHTAPAPPPLAPSSASTRIKEARKKRFSKREVARAVQQEDLARLTEMALRDRLVLRKMQRLLYNADPEARWKAVLMLGGVAGAIAQKDPAAVGDLLRRLLYAANDSAAANWGTIETVGEIIRSQPGLYGSFVRHILGLMADAPSRPAILWAIGRIGAAYPKLVKNSSFFALFDLLGSKDAATRGYAVWALGQVRAAEAKGAISRMKDDDEEFELFDGTNLKITTIGKQAAKAIDRMEQVTMETQEKKQETTVQEQQEQQQQEPPEITQAWHKYQEAEILKNRGQSLDAMARFEEVLGIFDEFGYEAEVANICEKLGDIHVMRGNIKAAFSPYQRALAICEKKKDPVSTVIMLEKVIDLYRHEKEFNKALPYFFRALELVEELKDVKRSAFFLAGIGDIYERQGKIEDALDAYKLAEKLFSNMGAKEKAKTLQDGIAVLEKRLS